MAEIDLIPTQNTSTTIDNKHITNNSNNNPPLPTTETTTTIAMASVPGLAYFELNDNKKRKDELIKKSTDQIRCSFLKEGILEITTKISQLQKDLDDIRIEAITTENVLCKYDEPDDRQLQALERRFHSHQQQFDQLLSSSLLNQDHYHLPSQQQQQQQHMTASTSFTSTLSKVNHRRKKKKHPHSNEKENNNNDNNDNDNDDDEEKDEDEEKEEEEIIDDKKLKRRQRIKQLRQEYLQQLKAYDPNWEEDEGDWKSIQFSIKDGDDHDHDIKEKEMIKGKGKGKGKNENDHPKKKEKKPIKKKPTLTTKKNKKNGMSPSPTTSSSSFPSTKQSMKKKQDMQDDTSSIHSIIKKKKPNSLDHTNHPLSPPITSSFEQQQAMMMKLPMNNIYPSTSLDTPPITPIVASWIMDQQHQNENMHAYPSMNDHFSPPHSPLPFQQRPTSSSHPNRLSRSSLSKYDFYHSHQNRKSISSQPSIISSTRHPFKYANQQQQHRHSLYDDVMKYIDTSSTIRNDHGLNQDIYQLLSPRTENHQRSLSFHSSSSMTSPSSFYSTSEINSHWQPYNNNNNNNNNNNRMMMNESRYRRKRSKSNQSYYIINNNQHHPRGVGFSPLFYQLPLVALFIKQGIFGIFSILFHILFGIFSFLLGGIQRILSWFKFLSVLALAFIISLGRGPSHMLRSLDEMDYLDDENNNEMDENDHDDLLLNDYYIQQHSY
ncbi:unnamed protein product [Cunninghamella blakesleeana]